MSGPDPHPPPAYAELVCASAFSFLRATAQPDDLIRRAHALGYSALALTDLCSVGGLVRAWQAARETGLALVTGARFLLADDLHLILLAQDRQGYATLCRLISRVRMAGDKQSHALAWAHLDEGAPGCLGVVFADTPALAHRAGPLVGRMPGRAWLGVRRLLWGEELEGLDDWDALGVHLGLPCVAIGDVVMLERRDKPLHDTLTAIRLGCRVDEAGFALDANAERHLRPRERLAALFPAAWLAETLAIAARCSFDPGTLRYEYPEELVPAGLTADQHLRALTEVGFGERFGVALTPAAAVDAGAIVRTGPFATKGGTAGPAVIDAVRQQIEAELRLIAELRYAHFFLTVEDIVRFARSRGILCQGRGSAANSAVCYCLGITAVDPARGNLLFERFISKERDEPPDIDVDFEHQRRDEVIAYIYDKYGRDRAALAATVIRYRRRSGLRDAGRALGIDPGAVDRVCAGLARWDHDLVPPEAIAEAGLEAGDRLVCLWLKLAARLIGLPRHLSQHVGGFVISRGPLHELVPVENARMAGRSVIQWDKDDLEALGLLKVDVLALGMLSALRRGLDLLRPHPDWHGRELALHSIPAEDPATYAMLQRGESLGVFQVESRAQMNMLPRLKPATFYDLVIEVAIVRPGPIQGGMVHPYLRRKQGLELVTYPSPDVRHVLERTLGVPIFQEQVMQLAMVAAGFTAGEADQLRRAMAAWKARGGLGHFEQRLKQGMAERGYAPDFADRLFEQIKGFGSYGFPESHAASFALLVYASAWLKCHHPAAFAAALLDCQPLGFYSPAQIVDDARRRGVRVLPVDVRVSSAQCALEPPDAAQPALRLGLNRVQGLTAEAMTRLLAARSVRAFDSVDDLARRAALDRRDIGALAAAGALAGLSRDRHHARWLVAGVEPAAALFHAPGDLAAPQLPTPTEGSEIVASYRHTGVNLGRHPLALLRPGLKRARWATAAELGAARAGAVCRVAGLVTCRQRPGTASGVIFVTLEDETGSANIIVRASTAEAQRAPLLHARLLGVTGTVERAGPLVHVLAGRLTDLSHRLGGLVVASRDFH
ncbi:MAG: DNA polymerase III subunit alpha [Betaproteobacteria bacterium]|nr:DNA polymerase III subunit alpha [Betaproteobacteria bacterium]